jgi:hypothetical protein
MAIYHSKDNSFKLIFGNHELFAQFLRDFIPIPLLKEIQPDDIEDLEERYLPLFQDSRESDTVKRVTLKKHPSAGGEPPDQLSFFVIALLEHESKVNFRSCFKMLQYICLILDDWEKEQRKEDPRRVFRKQFRYPPVLPIVFYDGPERWTAETNFLKRTALSAVFEKYIPKFEYELVDLRRYRAEDIVKFNDTLSLVMLIDRIPVKGGESLLKQIPKEYFEQIRLKVPESLSKLLSDVLTVLMEGKAAPAAEIAAVSDLLERKEVQPMFEGFVNGIQYARKEAYKRARRRFDKKLLAEVDQTKLEIARKMKETGIRAEQIQVITGLSSEDLTKL